MSLDYLTAPAGEEVESNFKISLPHPKLYQIRCKNAEFKTSQIRTNDDGTKAGGNPMIVLTCEIISPESVMIKDPNNPTEKIKAGILGLTVSTNLTLTKAAVRFVKAGCACFKNAAGEPVDPATLDSETPNFMQFIGRTGYCMIKSTVESQRDEETGEFIMLPGTTEKKVVYQHKITELL